MVVLLTLPVHNVDCLCSVCSTIRVELGTQQQQQWRGKIRWSGQLLRGVLRRLHAGARLVFDRAVTHL